MYRVLVPVDTDEQRAISQARYVTNLPSAGDSVEAILLFVFQEEGKDLPEELGQFKTAARIGSVKRAIEHFEEADVDHTLVEESGDTVDDIMHEADQHDVDEIVMGGRKRSPAGKALFGSVTHSVIRTTDLPVVVTGTAEE